MLLVDSICLGAPKSVIFIGGRTNYKKNLLQLVDGKHCGSVSLENFVIFLFYKTDVHLVITRLCFKFFGKQCAASLERAR